MVDTEATQLGRSLKALGFQLVDDTKGLRGDLKWRHGSALDTTTYGSIWVSTGVFRAPGVRPGGYRRTLSSWVKPTRIDTSLRNPFAVWEGKDLVALLREMSKRITPKTKWPLAEGDR